MSYFATEEISKNKDLDVCQDQVGFVLGKRQNYTYVYNEKHEYGRFHKM